MQEVSGSIPLGSTSFSASMSVLLAIIRKTPKRKRGRRLQSSPRFGVGMIFDFKLVGEVSPTGFFRVSETMDHVCP
jgi:hypothetical protein